MRKLRLLSTALAVLILVATLGLAVPSINVEVQGIGAGKSPLQPVVCLAGFYFHFTTPYGVKLEFANPLLPGSTVYVVLRDYAGNLIASNHTTLSSELAPNTPILIGFTLEELDNASIPRTSVIVVDGMGNMIYNGTIGVAVQKLSSGRWNGELAQPINITYTGTEPLSNWPVKIVLSDDNPQNPYGPGDWYINWTFLGEHLDTIHFVDSGGNLLYYWIEIINTTDHYAVIWVNVTNIPPGGTTIWMIYGAGNFSSYNNGHKVFWFFDDPSEYGSVTGGGWEWINASNQGVRVIRTNFVDGREVAVLDKFQYRDREDGIKKETGVSVDTSNVSFVLEYWDYRESRVRGTADRAGVVNPGGNGYGGLVRAIGDPTLTKIAIDERKNWVGTSIAVNFSVDPVSKTWYLLRLKFLNSTENNINLEIFNETGYLTTPDAPMGTVSANRTFNFTPFYVYVRGGSEYYVTYIRIRPYINPEPTAQVDEWYRYLSSHPACNNRGYSEPSRPIEILVPVLVDNRNNPQLDNYVVNFSVPEGYFSSGWKYFYVTDENGNYLYFWNFTDKYRGKVYFWVNYTIPSYSSSTIYLHIVNEPTIAYDGSTSYHNPDRVFWYFNDTLGNISGGEYRVLNFNPAVLGSTYQGYVVDTFMRPVHVNDSYYGPYLYVMNDGAYYYFVAMYNLSNTLGVNEVGVSTYRIQAQNIVDNLTKVNPRLHNLFSLVVYLTSYGLGAHYYVYANSYYQGDSDSNAIGPTLDTPVLGQSTGMSSYRWLGIRPYHNPAPTITVESPRLAGP